MVAVVEVKSESLYYHWLNIYHCVLKKYLISRFRTNPTTNISAIVQTIVVFHTCLELITVMLLSFQNSCWWSRTISFLINILGHATRLSVHVCRVMIQSSFVTIRRGIKSVFHFNDPSLLYVKKHPENAINIRQIIVGVGDQGEMNQLQHYTLKLWSVQGLIKHYVLIPRGYI